MDQTAPYLKTEYLEDRHELSKVRNLIDEVGPLFARSFDRGAKVWPYELRTGSVWNLPDGYSFTTNAMILFVMAVAANRVRSSIQVPAAIGRHRSPGDAEFEFVFQHAWEELVKNCDAEPGRLTSSEVFGPNDPFSLTWVVELLACSGLSADEAFRKKVCDEAEAKVTGVFASPAKPVLVPGDAPIKKNIPEHTFPLLRVIQLRKTLQFNPPDVAIVREYLLGRLHQQLSASGIRGSNFDIAELVFALEGVLQIDPASIDAALLERVFEVVAESQQHTPYWRPVKPFVTTPQGFTLLPLSVEVANSLMRTCNLLDRRDGRAGYFTRNIGLFRRYADWLSSRVVRGKCYPRQGPALPGEPIEFTGWHSEVIDLPDQIHLWQTSQVYLFLIHYDMMLQRHIGFRALSEVGLSVNYALARLREKDKAGTALKYWATEGESKEPLAGLDDNSNARVFRKIRNRFVAPRDQEGLVGSAACSILLYGPPGTGKTGVAEDLAAALGFPLVTVTPSDFIRQGESEVEARAKDIFDALGEQSDMVVLFDEIDRMILDRDSADYRRQGDIFQFMTPSMLPKLKDLRSKARVVFVVATNYVDRIDPAAKRPGRIDDSFLVAPPDKKQRASIIVHRLKKEIAKSKSGSPELVNLINKMSESDLEEPAKACVFAVYGELVQWIREVVGSLPGGPITKTELINRLLDGYSLLQGTTIRMLSYGGRFRSLQKGQPDAEAEKRDESFPTAQEPFDEFLLILYLKLESGQDLDLEEKKLVERVVGRLVERNHLDELGGLEASRTKDQETAKKIVEAALLGQMRDKQIVEAILRCCKKWLTNQS